MHNVFIQVLHIRVERLQLITSTVCHKLNMIEKHCIKSEIINLNVDLQLIKILEFSF